MGSVEIINSGNGGAIVYREHDNIAKFSWEFAMPPALALIFGPGGWDSSVPWAAGRREEIYNAVGAEVLRQQAPGGHYTIDWHNGIIEILRG